MSVTLPDEPIPPRSTPAVTAVVATLIAMLVVRYGLVGEAALARTLGFSPDSLPEAWWTPLTYPIAGSRPLSLVVDIAALMLFGPRVEELWGTRRFARFLFVCSLGGALFHFLLGAGGSPLVGATSMAFGAMFAHVWLWKNDEVWLFGVSPVSSRALVIALSAAAVLTGIGLHEDQTRVDFTVFSHLGGFALAFFYLRVPQRERIEQLRQRISPVPDVSEEISRPIPRTPPRPRERPNEEVDDIVARSKAAVAKRRDSAPRVRRSLTAPKPTSPDELDRVLDKISAQGMGSLTAEERDVLERNVRRLRDDSA